MKNLQPMEDAMLAPVLRENMQEPPSVLESGAGAGARYILAVIRSNQRLIAIIFGAVFVLSLMVTMLMTPRYLASSNIQVNNSGTRFMKNQDDDESTSSSNPLDTDRFLKTQVDVLKSRGMAERVVKKLNLTRNEAFFASQDKASALAKYNDIEAQDLATKLLMKNLDVVMPKDSRVMSVTYMSNSPQISANIVNAYVSEFIQFNLQRRFESSSYARDFLADQLVDVKQKLEQSERELNAYARDSGLIRMNLASAGSTQGTAQSAAQQGGSMTTASLVQLNQAANDAKARLIQAESRWKAINSGNLLSASEVVTNQGMQQLLSQRSNINSNLEQDRARHKDDYPTVRAGEAQLAAIDGQIKTLATSIRNAVKAEYEAARQAEGEFTGQVAKLKAETLNEQDRTVRYGLLAREVDTNRELYDGLLQRYKELNASAGISASNIWVIDNAMPPLKPYSPNILKNLVIGFVLAFVITTATVMIKDQFDDSIRIPEDIENKIGLTLMGVVPMQNNVDVLSALGDPKSATTEAYNSLRGSLLYSTSKGLPHILAVTSAQAGEGKSTTSYALSMALSRVGKKVLLIDADLRRPSLHRLVDYDNSVGFSTLLTSREDIASAIQATSHIGFSVITSGPIPPSPTELFGNGRAESLLRDAAEMFDVVVMDCPPVLGLADAPMLAAFADGVLFVVEADRSRHGSLKGAIRRLRASPVNLLGGVLTKFDPLKASNRHNSYYGYEYYQYQYDYKAQK